MKTISICLIVKDEESTLERCLSSIASIADEIIIVDTGSTDTTKDIAKKFTSHVYDFIWEEDFSQARNFCQSFASKDLIFWMDADNYFLKGDEKVLHNLINTSDLDVVHIYEKGTIYPGTYKLRIFKRSLGFRWIWKIHEVLDIPYGVDIKVGFISQIQIEQESKKNNKFWNSYEYFEKLLQDNEDPTNSILYLRLIEKNIVENPQKAFELVEKLPLIHHYHIQGFLDLIESQKGNMDTVLRLALKKKLYISSKYWESIKNKHTILL